jgi:hypothetical protein
MLNAIPIPEPTGSGASEGSTDLIFRTDRVHDRQQSSGQFGSLEMLF